MCDLHFTVKWIDQIMVPRERPVGMGMGYEVAQSQYNTGHVVVVVMVLMRTNPGSLSPHLWARLVAFTSATPRVKPIAFWARFAIK